MPENFPLVQMPRWHSYQQDSVQVKLESFSAPLDPDRSGFDQEFCARQGCTHLQLLQNVLPLESPKIQSTLAVEEIKEIRNVNIEKKRQYFLMHRELI